MATGAQPLQDFRGYRKMRHKSNPLVSILCALLALIVLFTTVFGSMSGMMLSTAFATEERAEDVLSDAAEDFGLERSDEGFGEALETANEQSAEERSGTFSAVLHRVYATNYINNVKDATAASGYEKPSNGFVCDPDHPAAGTLVYHNCDVPNFSSEFLQDIAGFVIDTGVMGGERQAVTLDSQWFGLPSGIPGNHVPVDPNNRSVDYTALELYGYAPLKYTVYQGEFDHIKTMSSARALTNFGAMDFIRLSGNVIADAVAGSIDGAVSGWQAGMESGGILGAIGGAFVGSRSGGAAGGINSILDTSDFNVIATHGWYRTNFSETLYNARELTQHELAADAQQQFINMVSSKQPETAPIPEDLQAVQHLPEPPQNAIASCKYRGSDGEMRTMSPGTAPGVSEADCERAADRASKSGNAANSDWKWSKDGTQKQQSLADWKKEHSNYFNVASKYDLQCDLDTGESNRAQNWATFSSCWEREWQPIANAAREDAQIKVNDEWVNDFLDPAEFEEFIAENEEANFNAAFNRYICVDENGNDMRDSNGVFERVYDSNGNLNENCSPTREPIQNGLFGNGYTASQQAHVGADTRHLDAGDAILKAIFPGAAFFSGFANVFLGLSVFMTRVSNTVINLSFSPILETLGLNDIAVSFIETTRDSLFFPLALLVLAAAGITILINAVRQMNFMKQLGNLLLIVLTFIIGVVVMVRPEQTIRAVDTVPSVVEQAVLGAIFSAGSAPEDTMCVASGTVVEEGTPLGLDGKPARYNPSSGLRSLMCENWRAFAFMPWVYGQYGTGVNDLYGATSQTTSGNKVQNTNTDIIGSPVVRMGPNSTMTNWAVYQLDVMSSGTTTDRDYRANNLPGTTDPNLYRVVDFQAGPDNGARVDDRFFHIWSGSAIGERLLVAVFSTTVSFFGAITIIAYSITKVTISFVTTMMLMFLPFMLLFGLYPGVGMRKLQGYVGSLIALMLQRVMLAAMLAVMLTIVMATSNTDGGYLLVSIMTLAVTFFFFRWRKTVLRWISEATEKVAGASYGSSMVADPDSATKNALRHSTPGIVQNGMQALSGATKGFVTGGVGSFMAGQGFKQGASQSVRSNLGRLHNVQRRKGFGFIQGSATAIAAARQDAIDRQNRDKKIQEIEKELAAETDYTKDKQQFDAEKQSIQGDTGEKLQSPGAELLTANKAKTRQDLQEIRNLREQISKLEKKEIKKQRKSNSDSSMNRAEETVQDQQNIHAISRDQDLRAHDRRKQFEQMQEDENIDIPEGMTLEEFSKFKGFDVDPDTLRKLTKYQEKIDFLQKRIIQRENTEYKYSTEEMRMRDELANLRAEAERPTPQDYDTPEDPIVEQGDPVPTQQPISSFFKVESDEEYQEAKQARAERRDRKRGTQDTE